MAANEPPALPSAPDAWGIYKQLPGMVLGFHGCDRETAEKVLALEDPHLEPSNNPHDWLGQGIYFWEADPWRALEWAIASMAKPGQTTGKIVNPYVVGAVLDLGRCCNLLDYDTVAELERAYQFINNIYQRAGGALPQNKGGDDKFKRFRDKVVIDAMHDLRRKKSLPNYQTVRAAFLEGGELYPDAGFERKNHIQIAVLDTACIKAYFRLPS
jgi:hypothetical protein